MHPVTRRVLLTPSIDLSVGAKLSLYTTCQGCQSRSSARMVADPALRLDKHLARAALWVGACAAVSKGSWRIEGERIALDFL